MIRCYLAFTGLALICILLSKVIAANNLFRIITTVALLGISIFFSPIEAKNKPLGKKKRLSYKMIVSVLSSIDFLLAIFNVLPYTRHVLQEVFLYVAKNFSKIHRENCHELAAYLVSCSRSRAYDMLRKQREEPLEEVPDAPDNAPVPDDAAVSADNIQHLTELIGQMKPMYRDPLRLLAMGYTNREIAESLGLTDEVVRMRLFRGRKLLWKELNSRE